MSLNVLGIAEVAAEVGVKPRTVSAYRARGLMPAPAATLACGPIWTREQVDAWIAKRGESERRWSARVSEIEARHDAMVEAVMEREAPPERWRKVEQLKRNNKNARLARRGAVSRSKPTVTQELRRHAERLVEDAIRQHPDRPFVKRLEAEWQEAERLRVRLEQRQERRFAA